MRMALPRHPRAALPFTAAEREARGRDGLAQGMNGVPVPMNLWCSLREAGEIIGGHNLAENVRLVPRLSALPQDLRLEEGGGPMANLEPALWVAAQGLLGPANVGIPPPNATCPVWYHVRRRVEEEEVVTLVGVSGRGPGLRWGMPVIGVALRRSSNTLEGQKIEGSGEGTPSLGWGNGQGEV